MVVFGGVIAVSQVSSAQSRRANYEAAKARRVASEQAAAAACGSASAGATGPNGERVTTNWENGRVVRHHWGDGQACPTASATGGASAQAATRKPSATPSRTRGGTRAPSANASSSAAGNNGGNASASASATASATASASAEPLQIISDSCADSKLAPHDGFQKGDRCVDTEFGDVGTAPTNPSLLITQAPQQIGVNQPFSIKVSTRNLVRDRFLAAGKGGYYVERSLLNGQGLVRGHFHTACRMLSNTNAAPDPAPVPDFFVATEDGGGGATPDTVTVQVPGLPKGGTAQCSVWAGDASHRIPMMERANQTPAFDSVRIKVN